jgi:Na+/proline symporter
MVAKVLGYADYILFGASLVLSLAIGIYYSRSGGKQRSVEEYLMGNRRITCLPIALSLLVTFQSGISLLGLPVEIYYYGTQIYLGIVGMAIGYTIVAVFIVPVLYPLQITSVYEVGKSTGYIIISWKENYLYVFGKYNSFLIRLE